MKHLLFFILSFIIVCTFSGCATTRNSTSSERVRTEYIRQVDTLLHHDSTYVHDSVFVTIQGDTVFKYKFRTEYRDRIQYRTHNDTILRTDTVCTSVIKTVEQKQNIFQRTTQALGSMVIFIAFAFVIILLIRRFSPK